MLGARTTNAAPTEIPATAILPNRAQVLTAFGGTFEPTAKPTFLSQACQLCGATLLAPTAPPAPALPGGVVSPTLALSPVVTALGQLAATDSVDFGLAVGLDLANLVGGSPRARVTSSLAGFAGQALVGIGAVNLVSGSTYAIDANWSQLIIAGLAGFSPISWIVTEAEDTDGRLSRTRAFLYDPVNGLLFPGVGTTAIPTITAPGAAFVGSPEVTVADVLNAAIVPGATGRAFLEVTATDSAGRRWHMLVPDRDGATGTDTLQFPDLQTSSVAGLAAGTWQMLAEARLAVFSSSVDDFVLSERYRSEANYSRSKPVTFTVN